MAGEQGDQNDILVDARWLVEHRGDASVVLVDTRPAADFRAGHLRGARHFDPFPFHHADTGESGMREFRAQLEWIFSALGITGDETLVFYENDSGMRATRTAWLAEYMGHRRVRILDGGLKLAGAELTTAVEPVVPGAFAAAPRAEIFASNEYIVERLGRAGVRIFDVRTDEEYFGERVRARRAGALPGAVHLDWVNNVAANGAFKPPSELRAAFERLGAASGGRDRCVLPGRLPLGQCVLRAQACGVRSRAQLHRVVGRMGQPRRPADRASAPQMKRARRSQVRRAQAGRVRGVLLLSGFEPFGGERSNPSWEVAAQLDGREIGGLVVKAVRLPVSTTRAVRAIAAAIRRFRPRAVLGLGQAGGRPAISLEKVAINLAERRAGRESDGGLAGTPVVRGGTDALFARLPLRAILRALERRGIPAALSLSAGAYVCNSVMYATLHALRARPEVPAGFIHLPYAARQAVRHRQAPSMTLEMMAAAVEAAAAVTAAAVTAATSARAPQARPRASRRRG